MTTTFSPISLPIFLRRPKHPVQNRLDFKRFQARLDRQNPRRDARQMRGGPAGRRLLGERTQVALAVRLKLDLLAQLVSEVQGIVEQALVHRYKGRREWR